MNLLPPESAQIVLANFPLVIVSLLVYFGIFFWISWAAKRKLTGQVSDYVVASRNLGWVVVTFTMYASVLSGVGIAGFPGTVYSFGLPFVVTVLTGHALGLAMLAYFGPRIWVLGKEYDYATPGDLLGDYYQSDTVRLYTVIASILFNMTFIVAQLLAGGVLVNVLSGGILSFEAGIVIMTVVVSIHVAYAGLRGIAWLDFFNGLLILAMLVVFGTCILLAAGGLTAVVNGLGDLRDRFITIPGAIGVMHPLRIYGIFVGLSFGALVLSPSSWIRMYSASSKTNFKKVAISMLILWLFSHLMGSALIGAYGRFVFPEAGNPDFVSSLLSLQVMPVFLAALFLIAVLAAIISTTDTYVHVVTATIVRDLVGTVKRSKMSENQEFKLNRWIMIGVAVVGVLLSLLNPVLITPLAIFGGGITLQLLTPLLGAVTWSRASTEAALVAPGAGIILTFVWEMSLLPNPIPQLPGLATAFLVNVVLFFVVSLLTRPQSPGQVERFHGLLDRHF